MHTCDNLTTATPCYSFMQHKAASVVCCISSKLSPVKERRHIKFGAKQHLFQNKCYRNNPRVIRGQFTFKFHLMHSVLSGMVGFIVCLFNILFLYTLELPYVKQKLQRSLFRLWKKILNFNTKTDL